MSLGTRLCITVQYSYSTCYTSDTIGVNGQRSGKLDTRGKSVNVLIHVCVHLCVLVCVAPPIVTVGAWSMAGALRQLFEYYYQLADILWRDVWQNTKNYVPVGPLLL